MGLLDLIIPISETTDNTDPPFDGQATQRVYAEMFG